MSDLLAQIRANPDDDALRAVYADQLLAAGDPRGELIHLELALVRHLDPQLARRRRELRAAHAVTWWGLPPYQVWSRRGFADRVLVVDERDAMPFPRAMLDRELVRDLEMRDMPNHFLLPAFAYPSVRSVTYFSGCSEDLMTVLGPVRDRDFDRLVLPVDDRDPSFDRIDWLPRCRVLGSQNGRFELIARRLPEWHHLDALEQLEIIDGASCQPDVLADLVRVAPNLRTIRTVDPAHAGIPKVDVIDDARFWNATAGDPSVSIELPDHHLELEPVAPGEWRAIVDGEVRSIEWVGQDRGITQTGPLADAARIIHIGALYTRMKHAFRIMLVTTTRGYIGACEIELPETGPLRVSQPPRAGHLT